MTKISMTKVTWNNAPESSKVTSIVRSPIKGSAGYTGRSTVVGAKKLSLITPEQLPIIAKSPTVELLYNLYDGVDFAAVVEEYEQADTEARLDEFRIPFIRISKTEALDDIIEAMESLLGRTNILAKVL